MIYLSRILRTENRCQYLLVIVTGLPKEWQQTLQANGVTREEQEKNPQAVCPILLPLAW